MFDYESRHIIEALRSGIPSRAVGRYFSDARPGLMRQISDKMNGVMETGISDGMVVSGKYGEGKTHLLNTVLGMAFDENLVVSLLPLSKETPMDKLYLIYQKLMANTYLPGAVQPGIERLLEEMTPNSPVAGEMQIYAAKELDTDKLYYLLRAFLNTEDQDERYLLLSDLEGDFISNPVLRKIYRRIFNQPVKFNENFKKTAHVMDYFRFMAHLFKQLGYNGWVILLDEAELIGRLGKKTRLKAYFNLAQFLLPDRRLESVFSMAALSASFIEDVIDGKNEYENLREVYGEAKEPAESVLTMMVEAPQLLPLSKEEISNVLMSLQDFHGKAYDWHPDVSLEAILQSTKAGGYLLRTQIRAAIEFFDQLYQYGEAGKTQINELGKETFEEEAVSLEEVMDVF